MSPYFYSLELIALTSDLGPVYDTLATVDDLIALANEDNQ